MKRTLIAICIGTLTVVAGAVAKDNDDVRGGGRGRSAASVSGHKNAVSTQSSVRRNTLVQLNRSPNVNSRVSSHVQARETNTRRFRTQTTAARTGHRARERTVTNSRRTFHTATAARAETAKNSRGEGTFSRNGNRNVTVNRERNVTRQRNVTVVNHWHGDRFAGRNYVAFRNYRREFHDRAWWRNHYDRLTFVSGGWYFWNAGYWYPAWGYDPGYAYPYDGPVYGYGTLTPDQIIANVQLQLQRDGYYDGPVDGILGSQTREGIADFQADHGLAITSAIDEPTLATLGLS